MVRHIQALIFGHLRRRGYLDEDAALVAESEPELELDELATHHAAAVQGLIPFGERAGLRTTLFGEPVEAPLVRPEKQLCADHEGYSLHAAVRIGTGTGSRERLERLCRYVSRPAFAQDRLSVARDGSIVYRFRKAWRNGKTAVVMDPMTFLSRLTAQIPPPRFHVLSYFGVLAAAASRRDEIVPGYDVDDDVEPEPRPRVASTAGEGSAESAAGSNEVERRCSRAARMWWSELVQRVFLEDVLRCPCGGRRRILAMIFNPISIERVLRHLGLPHEPMPRAPPRPLQVGLPFSA